MKIHFQTVADLKPTSRIKLNNGFLLCVGVKLAKPMVKDYYAGEFGVQGHEATDILKVYTAPDVLFSQPVIDGFTGADVVMAHPQGNVVTSDNYKDHIIGTAKNIQAKDGYLTGDLIIKDKWAIVAIEQDNIKQISLGYAAELDMTAGVTDVGQPYDGQWVQMVADHVAVVKDGRCGEECAIGDQKPNSQVNNNFKNQQEQSMKVKIGNLEFDIGDNATLAQAIQNQNAELEALKAGEIKVGDTAFNLTENKAVQATIDKLVADKATLEAENTTLKANQIKPEDVEKLVADRAKVIDDAKKLNPQIVGDGKTVEQIRKEVVTARADDNLVKAIVGDMATAEQSAIDTAFKALVATADSNPAPNPTDVALNAIQQATQQTVADSKADKPFDKSKLWENN